jgi:nucleotide-binding universal stress UspA family protein
MPGGSQQGSFEDEARIVWRADVGARVRATALADHLRDVDTAVSVVGERWGFKLARATAYDNLLNSVGREGPRALERAAVQQGFGPVDFEPLADWTGFAWRPLPPRARWPYSDPPRLIEVLADSESQALLGSPLRVVEANYRNPLELVLGGSGTLVVGAIWCLRFIRDWSNKRRFDAAKAHLEEARAREADAEAQQAQARAREADVRADLLRWLLDEAKAGRMVVPPGELLDLVQASDADALDRLAKTPVELELPEQLDVPPPAL